MPELTMRPTVRSEVGGRESNEDDAFASPRLVVVADGVGGAAAGEVASYLTILKMRALDDRRLVAPLEEELADAVADANALIAFVTFYNPSRLGMATTLTAVALANDGTYVIANVGDSRTYLFRDGQLTQLTRDDSLVQELIDSGELSEAEARRHPRRSVVLQALDGVERQLPPLRSAQGQVGDRLLLCSDGLSDYLADAEISELLEISDSEAAVRGLISAALRHGSRDNITVIIAEIVAADDPCDGWLDALPAPGARS